MPTRTPTTLIDELVRLNILPKDDVSAYLQTAKDEDKDFGQILIDKNLISPANLLDIKSKLYRLPIVNLDNETISREALKEISEDVVNFYKFVAFSKEGDTLKVGIVNPEDIDALEALKFITEGKRLNLETYLISYKDFDTIVRTYGSLTGEVTKVLETLSEELEEQEKVTPKKIEEITAEGGVTKIVASVVKYAVESRASDIHIEAFEEKVNEIGRAH